MVEDPDGYLPIQGMLDTLQDEEWFTQIRNWRQPGEPPACKMAATPTDEPPQPE
jgi:hypothetical protein